MTTRDDWKERIAKSIGTLPHVVEKDIPYVLDTLGYSTDPSHLQAVHDELERLESQVDDLHVQLLETSESLSSRERKIVELEAANAQLTEAVWSAGLSNEALQRQLEQEREVNRSLLRERNAYRTAFETADDGWKELADEQASIIDGLSATAAYLDAKLQKRTCDRVLIFGNLGASCFEANEGAYDCE